MIHYTAKHGILSFLALLLLLSQSDTVLSQSNDTVTSSDSNNQYDYTNVTPSLAVIVIVIVAALFFIGVFSVYIHHCYSDSYSSISPSFRPNAGRSRRGARGLDGQVIESFPMLHYSEVKDHKIGKGALECAVCLNEFEDQETLRLIPKCDHVFHPECIDAWLSSHVTCPVCRANLTPQPGESTADESTHPQTESTHPVAESTHPESSHEEEKLESHDVEAGFDRKTTGGTGLFTRSHTTGHSLVRPGQNTDRFTLRLPEEVRQRIMSRHLDRSMSMVVLPRERSSRRGYRSGDGSSRGKNRPPEKLGEPSARSDGWVFGRNPSFLTRASSFLTRASSSVRRPKVAGNCGGESSTRSVGSELKEPNRPPV